MIETWRIDDAHQTMILFAEGDALPAVAYWGPLLPKGEEARRVVDACRGDLSGGMLDKVLPVTVCPLHGRGFAGQPGLVLAAGDGSPLLPDLRLTGVSESAEGLDIRAEDPSLGLRYSARIRKVGAGVLGLSAQIEADAPVRVHWLAAPVLPASNHADRILDFAGRWIGEFQVVETPWAPGVRMREAQTGRSGHEHFPGAYLPEIGATNTRGRVCGLSYGWSGGHRMLAEELADGQRQIQFGHATGSEREAGRRFETATLYATASEGGLNGPATTFQAFVHDHLVPWPKPDHPRPVVYNCWEAIYFQHGLEDLTEIATRAAALGAERFVLDDGWFGKRDDDTTSLGDWSVDRRKWPDGLGPLIDEVQKLDISFGLWVEPEMVSPESDLYRAHPDWILGPADQVLGRAQFVLDLSREDVRDHLFTWLDALLAEHPIAYLKWDHNRVLPISDSAQTRGIYDLVDRLRAAHPEVEIESCASGGGRIDYGILARTHRVWLSDSNDAAERLRMQHDAALFLPASITGSHVGPKVCHSSGRTLSIGFRAWVAAQRHMGFEMDLRDLSDDEAQGLADVTAWWKSTRDWRMNAPIHRLDASDPEVLAEIQIARDGSRFVAFSGQARTSRQIFPRALRMTGLDPDAFYEVELLNRASLPRTSRGEVALAKGPLTLSGVYLMEQGLVMPVTWPETIWAVEGRRL